MPDAALSSRMRHDDPIPELKRDAAAKLVAQIQHWNATVIAVSMRTDQPRISDLRRGHLDRFSLETLIRFLARLDCTIELKITYPTRGLYAIRKR